MKPPIDNYNFEREQDLLFKVAAQIEYWHQKARAKKRVRHLFIGLKAISMLAFLLVYAFPGSMKIKDILGVFLPGVWLLVTTIEFFDNSYREETMFDSSARQLERERFGYLHRIGRYINKDALDIFENSYKILLESNNEYWENVDSQITDPSDEETDDTGPMRTR